MGESCLSPWDTSPKHHLVPADWSEERGLEWRQQREAEVKEERQRAAAEYTASPRARLGDDRLPLLLSPTGVNQSWLAHELRWVRACVGWCSVPPAQAH